MYMDTPGPDPEAEMEINSLITLVVNTCSQ